MAGDDVGRDSGMPNDETQRLTVDDRAAAETLIDLDEAIGGASDGVEAVPRATIATTAIWPALPERWETA